MNSINSRRLKHSCVALAWVLYCAGAWAAPEPANPELAKAKLAAVRARIADLTNRLGDELKQRDVLSARLRDAELAITAKRQRLETLRAAEADVGRHRTELRALQGRAQNALQAERAVLGQQVRAAYMIGRQEQLRLLLNQSNPARLGRTLAYYGYFARERSGKVDAIQSQVLGLQSLVADLARVMQDFPVDATQSFDRMRGKLPWPVQGRVTAHYQQQHANSAPGMRWNGEMIEAARGAKVRAPYFGRVVYADWLQGLGLLLIIGHSGGYMTLYGHAEVLYKSVGDWVAPGDVIAALSDAGGPPQLYFEIREGRKPQDPKVWLKSNP